MNITRFVATADGGSRFARIDLPLTDARQDAAGHTIRTPNPYRFREAARLFQLASEPHSHDSGRGH